ncbi:MULTISPECIES: dipeptide ABC transporter ATP-binding protein [Cyanophyceae]|uniref:dipeptide ABC transporter ATP-binding protein n=1 Tax=Cyanophyceae TaxID=3028117 RepID=UPI00232DB5D8|nr:MULTISPECIES: ABC transporter ATP-binding protein [Cyanophyceae]MDB9354783.1 ABC transporter ATP-binding protein [Nodularia spumigena CS-587/03]MDB9306194.1 ABC transporter ATP-binding protein [Nodularia spumigena CS-591/12]MDB9318832.1 ABC transporter ATP-binding protein [Nodularia spumigena CS-590/01A]MDB9320595.1 ABC transporter ATP-binding protein [Nodularia spumigena CS-591/07A]MDB9326389.1 ABC transporter ATP-binding protein [Nodularia spumigena CS-590/02]
MSEALFSIENLRVAYPQRHEEAVSWAVDDVSFTLQPGERMGLVGESGCGKSTLGRAAMRLLPPDSRVEGRVTFQGESVFDLMPQQLRKFRGEAIALIFQDPMTRLDPLMTIGKHCIETLQAHSPTLSTREAKKQAIATLEKVNIPASRWDQYPHEFSGGMRQRVAIALALLLNPKLIVADEPTTSLDVTVSAQILQELTRLCSQENMALLLISHDLAMVGEYCDRIGVMYQGKMVEMGATETVFQQPQHEYTRSLLKAALHIQAVDETNQEETSSSPILRITELQQHYSIEPNFIERLWKKQGETIKAVDGINLELYQGEILGLVGESGCGKSTLSRTILQLIRPTAGKVEFLGQDLISLSRQEIRASRRQMQMIFQDPHACLNPVMTVGQSIADPLFIHNLADAEKAKSQVLWMLEKVGLTPPELYYQRYPSDLSGGQQQRVAIARALITRPKLLICDEPVSMLDASVQSQVLDLMLELKVEFELTYLFITHDLWLARFLCDRIAVMHSGKIVELGNTKQIFTNPQHSYTKSLLAAAPLLARS